MPAFASFSAKPYADACCWYVFVYGCVNMCLCAHASRSGCLTLIFIRLRLFPQKKNLTPPIHHYSPCQSQPVRSNGVRLERKRRGKTHSEARDATDSACKLPISRISRRKALYNSRACHHCVSSSRLAHIYGSFTSRYVQREQYFTYNSKIQ